MVNYEALVSCLLLRLFLKCRDWRKTGKRKEIERQKRRAESYYLQLTLTILHEEEDQPVGIMDASCASVPKPAPD
jgi:hypothetical protein